MKAINVIFDLDGTLVDSRRPILESLRKACREHSVCEEISEGLIGPPVADIVRSLEPDIGKDRLAEVVAAFRASYDACPERGILPYAGVPEGLSSLSGHGCPLFMATNKPAGSTHRVLAFLQWNMFRAVACLPFFSGEGTCGKADLIRGLVESERLEKEGTVMVGDTVGDVMAARRNGIKAVAALWGFGPDKEELRTEADLSFSHPADLFDFLLK